jgi:serine/threonine protein kinase
MPMPTLEELVSNGKTKEAIEQLRNLLVELHNDTAPRLAALSSRAARIKAEENKGTVTVENKSIEFNNLDYSFLGILHEVQEAVQSNIGFFKPMTKEENENNILKDFLVTVLAKKYEDIKFFHSGSLFIYYSAKEKISDVNVMVMVAKGHDIDKTITKKLLQDVAKLKHRNLIQLLDNNFYTDSYPRYLVTEFVSGVDLKTLMKNIGAFPLHNAKRLLMIIGDVMNNLKLKRFNHAGMRPSHIMIDFELEPELSPFDLLGIEEKNRLLKSFTEDCYYFAPERLYDLLKELKPNALDRANQFCLAALGYEMITAEKLFKGDIVTEILFERDRFFKEETFRMQKMSHPRLPKRLALILKRMLNEDPKKRYEDLATALKEIAKVRVPMNDDDEKVFNSYRRCLANTEDFMAEFYKRLSEHPEMSDKKQPSKTEDPKLVQKFYIDTHLILGIQNFNTFMENDPNLKQGEKKTITDYELFFTTFIETIADCDPRYKKQVDLQIAWGNIKKNIIDQIAAFLPKIEIISKEQADEGRADDSAKMPSSTETSILMAMPAK